MKTPRKMRGGGRGSLQAMSCRTSSSSERKGRRVGSTGQKAGTGVYRFPSRKQHLELLTVRVHTEDFGRPNVCTRDHCVKTFEVRVGVRFHEAEFLLRRKLGHQSRATGRFIYFFYQHENMKRNKLGTPCGYATHIHKYESEAERCVLHCIH